MSQVKISGNASGTGVLTIAAPNTNTDRTLDLPDSAGTVATAESTLSQFNASGSAPVYACRAWVNFNGTGTVAIRASGNVTSITDNATGNYTVNFTTALPDANYATVFAGGDAFFGTVVTLNNNSTYSTTASRIRIANNSSSPADADTTYVCLAFFR